MTRSRAAGSAPASAAGEVGHVGAEVHDAHRPARRARGSGAAVSALLASVSRAAPSARSTAARARRPRPTVASTSPPWTDTTSGASGRRAPHRVAGRDGVVGVHEVEGERPAQAAQAPAAAPGPPRLPTTRRRAGAAARGSARSRTSIPSSSAWRRLAQRRGDRRPVAGGAARRADGQRPVQHQDAHVGAGVAGGQRLAVRPHAEHGVAGARVVLGDARRRASPRCGARPASAGPRRAGT